MRWAALGSVATVAAALAAVCLGSGCSTVGYYAQSVGGHLDLLQRVRPIDHWLADPATPPALKARLQVAQQARRFAVTDLALPDNASYTRHADLGRTAVVWNVVAAPPLSLTLKTWCYPVMGCVGYRGYFDQAAAEAEGAALRAQGLEVSVYGVPAYSTLGWTNWLGGDPLLNTLVGGSESFTVRLIFHELAHGFCRRLDAPRVFANDGVLEPARSGSDRESSEEADALRDLVDPLVQEDVLLVPELVKRIELRAHDVPMRLPGLHEQ